MFCKRKLQAQMKLHGDTFDTLSKAMGISRSTLNVRMNEYRNAEFTRKDMDIIRDRYNLTDKELLDIFFAEEPSKLSS